MHLAYFNYFFRQGENDVEAQLKVAEILQLLAEISMESDNNPAAINDLKECLVIKRRHLKPDNRLLAETYPFIFIEYYYRNLRKGAGRLVVATPVSGLESLTAV